MSLLSKCMSKLTDMTFGMVDIFSLQWMPFDEYAAQPMVQNHELYNYTKDLCLAKGQGDCSGFSPVPITSFLDDKLSHIYLNSRDLNKSPVSPDQS